MILYGRCKRCGVVVAGTKTHTRCGKCCIFVNTTSVAETIFAELLDEIRELKETIGQHEHLLADIAGAEGTDSDE